MVHPHRVRVLLILLLAVNTVTVVAGLPADTSLAGCRATLQNNVFTLENNLISRTYRWNEGQLVSTGITDKASGVTWQLDGKMPDSQFPAAGKASDGSFTTQVVKGDVRIPDHLEAIVINKQGELEVKKVFRIYPGCAAIACDYYLRGKAGSSWWQQGMAVGDLKNIEGKSGESTNKINVPVMERLALPGRHWRVKAVQFADITDRNNNLVQEVTQLLYRGESRLQGNLLMIDNLLTSNGLFLLKESPAGETQLAYPGFDFVLHIGDLQVTGIGIDSASLSKDEWIRCYGIVTGVTGKTELEKLTALRAYQQNMRIHKPGRDEMLMLNTWGDRNQDKKIGEQFALEELAAGKKLGITHFQIDDGWQKGKSGNSAYGGSFSHIWDQPDYWVPDPKRFPAGFTPVMAEGKKNNIEVCVWFNPDKENNYAHWQDDAGALLKLYKEYGIRTFKIDGVQVYNKQCEINLRRMLDTVMKVTNNQAVFNLDVTAGKRYGYHYFNEYGNIFLENRYTDWAGYYPHWTMRNLWMLSKYVPAQNLQVEFLNNFRSRDKYMADDSLAPGRYSFEYLFAVTMMAQPLAWMEASGLPAEAFSISPVVKKYAQLQQDIHAGKIFPIGDEPSGTSWTGFQSLQNNSGYLLIFRELNNQPAASVKTWLPKGKRVTLQLLAGTGKKNLVAIVNDGGALPFSLPDPGSYALYHYQIAN